MQLEPDAASVFRQCTRKPEAIIDSRFVVAYRSRRGVLLETTRGSSAALADWLKCEVVRREKTTYK